MKINYSDKLDLLTMIRGLQNSYFDTAEAEIFLEEMDSPMLGEGPLFDMSKEAYFSLLQAAFNHRLKAAALLNFLIEVREKQKQGVFIQVSEKEENKHAHH